MALAHEAKVSEATAMREQIQTGWAERIQKTQTDHDKLLNETVGPLLLAALVALVL